MGKKLSACAWPLALCLGLLPVTALAVDTAPQNTVCGQYNNWYRILDIL